MKLLRRHKSVLIALGIYWPFIFWLTHIPVPSIARQSGMSDKTMHVIAYSILTFLVWFAISPYHKVRWDQRKVWIALITITCYGVIDEYLQARVGRSGDVMDLQADMFGVIIGLGLLSIFNFWPALLTVSASFIFIISNQSNLLMLPQYHSWTTIFHFTAYASMTLIWIQFLDRYARSQRRSSPRLFLSAVAPICLLGVAKVTAPFFDRPLLWPDVGTALIGIGVAMGVSFALAKSWHRKSKNLACF
jgi:VanZ family protein